MEQLLERFPKNVSLGLGYQSVVHRVAVNSAIKTSETDENINPQISIHVETSTEVKDVGTKVDAALTVSAGNLPAPVSVDATVKSHFENTHTDNHAYTIITINRITRSTSYKNVTLKDEALALLQGGDEDLKDFYAKYGDAFIRRITYGNKVVLVLRTDKSEAKSLKQLETKLGGKVDQAEVAANLAILRQKLSSIKTEDRLFISIGNKDFFETKSDAVESSLAQLEPVKLESPKLSAKPDATKTDGTKPEAPKPDATKPDAAAKPEAPKPALTKALEAVRSALAKPDAAAEPAKPEAPKADATKPEAPKAEAPKADAAKPAADKPKANAGENPQDIEKKLAAYLESDSTAVVDYDKDYYGSVLNVKSSISDKLKTLVSNEIGTFVGHIDVYLEKLEKTKILDPNNIVEQNQYPAKTRDAYYEQYESLKTQAKDLQEKLLKLKATLLKTRAIPTGEEKRQAADLLAQAEDFFAKNERALKTAPKLTLMREILLAKGKENTNGFKLDFSEDMKTTTKFLFIRTEDKDTHRLQVKMLRVKYSCPTEENDMSARGCYVPSNIGRNYLVVKLIDPGVLDHDIGIKIYAASEASLKEYKIASLNESFRKTRPLDGAVGEDFVDETVQGYVNYGKEEHSNAELTSSMGLDYDEGEDFAAETVADYEAEISQSQRKSALTPRGL